MGGERVRVDRWSGRGGKEEGGGMWVQGFAGGTCEGRGGGGRESGGQIGQVKLGREQIVSVCGGTASSWEGERGEVDRWGGSDQ
jgi:hypothetical protein